MANLIEVRTNAGPVSPEAVVKPIVAQVPGGIRPIGEKTMRQIPPIEAKKPAVEAPVIGGKPAVPTAQERRPLSGKGI